MSEQSGRGTAPQGPQARPGARSEGGEAAGSEDFARPDGRADATDSRLLQIVTRIERISDEIAGLQEDRKDVFAEAKAVGYDVTVLRKVIARRAAGPDAVAETDAMVEAYEAALGDPAAAEALASSSKAVGEQRHRELAIALLDQQIEGVRDPAQADALAEHIAVLIDIRAEIAGLREQERARIALAKGEGFEPKPMKAVVRWIEKCAKHGQDAMRAGEAVFQMYRGAVEGAGRAPSAPVSADPALQTKFGAGGKGAKGAKLAAWLNTGRGN
jgi:uncharacterized protein (UPF0335 family)